MRTLAGFEGWPSGELHVAIGVFDGVHLGHRALLARLRAGARAAGATGLAATFDPLPARVLDPTGGPLALTDALERAVLLHAAGADEVVVFAFDRAFAALGPAEFAGRLAAAGAVRRVVVGPDFQFGHGRSGAAGTLRGLGERHGFTVEVVEPVTASGTIVSSTRIRALLGAGDLAAATALLGRAYTVGGTVVRGDHRGAALGWPTLNLATPPERLLPRDGIYAAWVEVAGARRAAAASLGVRPTFGAGLERRLEAHLLDFSDELYGERATVTFVRRLRDELRFETPAALSAQIARDVAAARAALAGE